MPAAPNTAVARLETTEVTMNNVANTSAGPRSNGFLLTGTAIAALASSAGDLKYQYCQAQIANAASDKPASGSARCRASTRLKIATTARIRRYMIAVAS